MDSDIVEMVWYYKICSMKKNKYAFTLEIKQGYTFVPEGNLCSILWCFSIILHQYVFGRSYNKES